MVYRQINSMDIDILQKDLEKLEACMEDEIKYRKVKLTVTLKNSLCPLIILPS